MGKIIDTIIGSVEEKREYKQNETRARSLPGEYSTAYKEIKNYLFQTSGIITMEPLQVLVDILEEAAANGKHVLEVTGPDVAAFADELVKGVKSYQSENGEKLNATIVSKLSKSKK